MKILSRKDSKFPVDEWKDGVEIESRCDWTGTGRDVETDGQGVRVKKKLWSALGGSVMTSQEVDPG